MDTKHKERYEAPSTQTFEVKIEGNICTSGNVNANMGGVWDEEDF